MVENIEWVHTLSNFFLMGVIIWSMVSRPAKDKDFLSSLRKVKDTTFSMLDKVQTETDRLLMLKGEVQKSIEELIKIRDEEKKRD